MNKKTLGRALAGLLLSTAACAESESRTNRTSIKPMSTQCEAHFSSEARDAAISQLRSKLPQLESRLHTSGVTRTLSVKGGVLSEPSSKEAVDIARAFLQERSSALGLSESDIEGLQLSNMVAGARGTSHVFFNQSYRGVPLLNAQMQLHFDRKKQIVRVNNNGVAGVEQIVEDSKPLLSASDAIILAAADLGLGLIEPPKVKTQDAGPLQRTVFEKTQLSPRTLVAELNYVASKCTARLGWRFTVSGLAGDIFDVVVDAETGALLARISLTDNDQYAVFALPLESPNDGSRGVVVDPANVLASEGSWHDFDGDGIFDTTIVNGNNVSITNQAPLNCGPAIDCSFPFTAGAGLATNLNAAMANAFYVVNTVHDVAYNYGFHEGAGNFELSNSGGAGIGLDSVDLRVQDASDVNNASFATFPDGIAPIMRMHRFVDSSGSLPDRDSSLDNSVLIHEYTHGISRRLIGGPATTSCMSLAQQPGEGVSDFLAMAMTHRFGDDGDDPRGMGTFVSFESSRSDPGIRTQRYGTDPAVNDHSYASIDGMVGAHGVGEVWAQAMWDAYWAMVDLHGFDSDLYNLFGRAGNVRMLEYFFHGLGNTSCDPTFVDMREGIFSAAVALNGPLFQDECVLRNSFASFGLGDDAVDQGPDRTDVENGYEVPNFCGCVPPPADLLGWWTFDEPSGTRARDQVGFPEGEDGIELGGGRPGRGVVGNGRFFNGSDARVRVAANARFASIDPVEGGLSIEAWVKPRVLPTIGQPAPIAVFGDAANTITLSVDWLGALVLQFRSGGVTTFSLKSPNNLIQTDRFTHVAAVMDGGFGSNNTLFINGNAQGSAVGRSTLPAAKQLDIGGTSMGIDAFFHGHIDEVTLYSGALDPADLDKIAFAFNAGKCKIYCDRPLADFDNVAYMSPGNYVGTSGDDLIFGSSMADTIEGKKGNDCIYGFEGDDSIEGDADNDEIWGGRGVDTIHGRYGDDKIFGGPGDDLLWGDHNDDVMHGGSGDDTIRGELGNDILHGDDGDDALLGGDGDDTLFCGPGDDHGSGNEGEDTVNGGPGRDVLHGNQAADIVNGDDGDDLLWGDLNDDTVNGGSGNDSIEGGDGDDTLSGGSGTDRLRGGDGADRLRGGSGFDFLGGDSGDDQLFGDDGDDRLCGEAGDDDLDGGSGTDEGFEGTGTDTSVRIEVIVSGGMCTTAEYDAWLP